MPSQRRWRQRLLGSLEGQLQLAIYLVVFAGFTGASTAGLGVGQRIRNLLIIQLQHRHEGFLGNIHLAHRLHPLLTLRLFLQQFLLP